MKLNDMFNEAFIERVNEEGEDEIFYVKNTQEKVKFITIV